MTKTMIDRIYERLDDLGMSASAASRAAGLGQDYIRDLKRKVGHPGAESLAKLAKALKVSPDFLLTGKTGSPTVEVVGLPVVGVIEAGQFRDITLVSQDEDYPTVNVVKDERNFPHARQYALRVSGDSMDKYFPNGSFVICAEFGDTGLALKPGLVLHVERSVAGTHLVETTLKEVEVENGTRYLAPRSSNPRHKRIEVNGDDDMIEYQVRGVVIGSYNPWSFS